MCCSRNVDLVRSLGADHVVDYTRTDFTRTEKRYDVILDNVEAQPLAAVRRALTPTGILIPNSGRGGRWLGPLGRIVKARVLSGFTRQQLKPFTSVGKRQDLLTLADLLATGQVTPVIDRTYDEAADALRYVAAGHTEEGRRHRLTTGPTRTTNPCVCTPRPAATPADGPPLERRTDDHPNEHPEPARQPADPRAGQARSSMDKLHVPLRLRGHSRLLQARRRR